MDWQAALRELRTHLPRAREAWGVPGSLRWLEEAMRARGANPSSVRNIVYRDIGTANDKLALHGLLSELAAQAGQSLPPLPVSLRPPLPAELELLGRQKRRAYRQFLAAVRQAGQGAAGARLIVSGPPGAGKTLLNRHLERAISQLDPAPPVRRLTLGGDLAALFPGTGGQEAQPFAVQAAAQAQATRALIGDLSGVLLLRVERSGSFGGVPPRAQDGAPMTLTAWAAEHLYRGAPAGLSVLLAAEDEAALPAGLPGDRIRLAPPTPTEARRYLMAQLDISAQRADELVQQTGRHLDRLTLLAAARNAHESGPDTLARLLSDPAATALLSALSVTFDLPGGSTPPRTVLEAALGRPLDGLPAHVRALLDESEPEYPRPHSARLLDETRPGLPAAEQQAALARLAAGTAQAPGLAAYHLAALARLDRWDELKGWLEEQPGGLALAPALWTDARGRIGGEAQEALARAVVAHHAMLGAYTHPQARDALFTLLDSPRSGVRAWARVKLAESSVDGGHFEAAEAQLNHPELSGPLAAEPVAADRWLQGAWADALLVGAALARWRGDLDTATRLAADPRTLNGGPLGNPARASLWRGLIAKDAGRWAEAVGELGAVPESHPLLSARARYQEGDLRLRLGQPAAALVLLQDAARRLGQEHGAPEEQARVQARIATAQRRLGHPEEALEWSRAASRLAEEADPVLRARLDSESIPVLLALFRPNEALRVGARALDRLACPGPRHAEAAYRTRRTHFRIALSYLTRAAGQPYLQPFGGLLCDSSDAAQARQVLDALLAQDTGGPDREEVLTFDILLSRALAEPDAAVALTYAGRALDMTDHPYAETQARATLADAHLRAGQIPQALHETNRGHALLRRVAAGLGGAHMPDPGLHATLLALETRCALAETPKSAPEALAWLLQTLQSDELRPFGAQVWRQVGASLEGAGSGAQDALTRFPGLRLEVFRLQDALSIASSSG